MKNVVNILILIVACAILYMLFFPTVEQDDRIDELQTDVAELKQLLMESEKETTEIIRVIERTRTIRDTVWMEIVKMDPKDQLIKFDSLTGDFGKSVMVEGNAYIEMPRIENALIQLVEKKYLLHENHLMQQAITNLNYEKHILNDMLLKNDTIIGIYHQENQELKKSNKKLGTIVSFSVPIAVGATILLFVK